jgi:circadian clock protein KaiC
MHGQMRRAISVLKMRGSQHDKEIRDFTISSEGIRIGEPIRNVTGMIVGQPRQVASGNGPPDARPDNRARN